MTAVDLPYLVVGSGPAGAATAAALCAAGQRVELVDVGLRLEGEQEEARARLAATAPGRWQAADIARTTYRPRPGAPPGYKEYFGSDLAFREVGPQRVAVGEGAVARPSYALGGLSTVWGAGILPYGEEELSGWPLSFADLKPHYAAALALLPYSARADPLAERFPLLRKPDGALLPSPRAEALLERLAAKGRNLGLRYGQARLAVRVGFPAPAAGCCYCGRCLEGCPYGHIYCASQTVARLRREGALTYRPGLFVWRLWEEEGAAALEARPVGGGPPLTLRGRRLFLAAGALSSTVILQRSGYLEREATLLDSQTVYLPFLDRSLGAVRREGGHALAQLFLLLEEVEGGLGTVHLSYYTAERSILLRGRAAYPRLGAALWPLANRLAGRIGLGIAFLPSPYSNQLVVRLEGEEGERVAVASRENPRREAALRTLLRALSRRLSPLGLLPLAPFVQRGGAGAGFHFGGSLPLSREGGPGRADLLGRPPQAKRIHLVDSASFPTIPSGPITLSGMANGWRVATAAVGEDRP